MEDENAELQESAESAGNDVSSDSKGTKGTKNTNGTKGTKVTKGIKGTKEMNLATHGFFRIFVKLMRIARADAPNGICTARPAADCFGVH